MSNESRDVEPLESRAPRNQEVRRGAALAANDGVQDGPFVEIYDELRRLAASKLAREPAGHTLQTTALVHEAWLRLEPQEKEKWTRTDFFVAAAAAMRRVLIDHIRRRRAVRRGGGARPLRLFESKVVLAAPESDILAVDEALEDLERDDPLAAKLVQLRYFGGFHMQEAADALGISLRSAHRVWRFARAWLRRELSDGDGSER